MSDATTIRIAALVQQIVNGAFKDGFRDLVALYPYVLAKFERPLLEAVLHRCHGNQTHAAKALGINRNTLRKKMKEHKLL